MRGPVTATPSGRGCACRRGPVCDTQTESPQHRTFVVCKLACLGSLYFTSLAPVHRLASQACTTSRQLDDTRASPRFYPSVLRRPPQSVMIANRSGVNKGSTYIEWKENRLNTRRLPFVTTVWCSHLTHTNGGLRYRAAYHSEAGTATHVAYCLRKRTGGSGTEPPTIGRYCHSRGVLPPKEKESNGPVHYLSNLLLSQDPDEARRSAGKGSTETANGRESRGSATPKGH